jgi:hypothetical protein
MQKIIAKQLLHAALFPPRPLVSLMENPEQHAKNEKIVARMMVA